MFKEKKRIENRGKIGKASSFTKFNRKSLEIQK